ncbi:tumor necrosis factor receptor superfamily member 14-like [Cololabis saira]|uniref:tumor necrosis factor receptor superfamily member 14-like n=1 Tax=Cololabis saira TaxID=129043 RepID=UPI002AD52F21|nr:tumor necrosis factor receptor superfamily member 14-like [Cololabis saira]
MQSLFYITDDADLVCLKFKISVRWFLQLKKTYYVLHKMILRGIHLTAPTVLIILMRVFSVQTLTCHRTEYQTGNECCPMCPAGSRVKTHCTEFRSTSCLPCEDGTFMDKLNGLKQCHQCSNCDTGSGLKTTLLCTPTSDTVCEPVEGFFCIDPGSPGCTAAQKHKSCEPGQYIRERGTASSDTECSDCSSGTFSNGTLTSCQPHTQCETKHLQVIKAGTASTDAECGEQSFTILILAGVVVPVVFLCLVVVVFIIYRRRKIKGCVGKVGKNGSNKQLDGNEVDKELQSLT